jgi:hypothetical protein
MNYKGMPAVSIRSNLWGEFAIVKGGNGGFGVYVQRNGIMDRRDVEKRDTEPKLFLCATLEQAKHRQNYEASKYKRYRYY